MQASLRAKGRASSQPQQRNQPQQNLLKTGAAAEMARAQEAQRQQAMRNKRREPRRLWVPWEGDEKYRTKEYIILDNDIEQCPVFLEHEIIVGEDREHVLCIREIGHCSTCEKVRAPYYVQVMTVQEILAKPFESRFEPGRMITHLKTLVPIKWGQQEWFRKMCREDMRGNMRGVHIMTTRDPAQKSPAIGTPRLAMDDVQQADGSVLKRVVRYSEEEILEFFGHPERRNKDGKVVAQANQDCYPFNYSEEFPTPTEDELRVRFGGTAPAGSQAEIDQTWGQSGEEEAASTDSVDAPQKVSRTSRTPLRVHAEHLQNEEDKLPF